MGRHTTSSRATAVNPDRYFRALGDMTRLRMLVLLISRGELCVCELTQALQESQPKISRHLAQLRELGVVLDRRQGQWIYYRMNPALPAWAREVLAATTGAVSQQDPFSQDLRALQDMRSQPQVVCCS